MKTTHDKKLAEKYAANVPTCCSVMKQGHVFCACRAKPEGFCDTAWRRILSLCFALANGGGKKVRLFGDRI